MKSFKLAILLGSLFAFFSFSQRETETQAFQTRAIQTPAASEAPEVVAVSEDAPAPRKPRARKPRVEAATQPVETSDNPE